MQKNLLQLCLWFKIIFFVINDKICLIISVLLITISVAKHGGLPIVSRTECKIYIVDQLLFPIKNTARNTKQKISKNAYIISQYFEVASLLRGLNWFQKNN